MEGHGFDCEFVDAVPDYLRCVVCRLVLREPVQIMKCGHRFCQHCFEGIKSHAATLGNQRLCCPIDRDMIDLRNVFQDTGIARVILNLQVRCPNKEAGCTWVGDLKETESHKEGCSYGKHMALQNPSALQAALVDANALNGLHDRMNKFENDAVEKEKDILHLKHNFNELKKQLDLKESQVQDWGTKYDHLENELRMIRSQNEELKRMSEKEMEVLTVRNQFLDYKVSSLEKQLMESKNISDDMMEQKMKGLVLACKPNDENDVHAELIEELRNKIDNVTDEIGTLKLKIEDNRNRVDTSEVRFNVDHKALDDRLLNLCTEVDELNVGFDNHVELTAQYITAKDSACASTKETEKVKPTNKMCQQFFTRRNLPQEAVVYTECCFIKNGSLGATGGIGVYWAPNHPSNISEYLDLPVPAAANNIAYLRAAARALESAISLNLSQVQLRMDSKYTIQSMTEWVDGWRKNGWKTASGDEVCNVEEMIRLNELCQMIGVTWVHVPGQEGVYGNEEAYRLAREGAVKGK